MKLDETTLEYLKGNKFSNSLSVPYDYLEPIPKRIALLTGLSKNKRIIHLGCLDHLPLIAGKIASGQWLHKELTQVASVCLGIDIDSETLKYVKANFGFTNIILGDFTKSKLNEIIDRQWDYAILGELLEHIDNPVDYLTSVRNNYAGCLEKIIITVPNAWTRTSMRLASQSIELINSDHRYWFTPYTLSKVVMQAGMTVEDVYFANRVPLSNVELVKNKIFTFLGKQPAYNFTYASSIVIIAKL